MIRTMLMLLAAAAPLAADVVELTDGRSFDGEVISPPGADEVKLQVHINGMTSVLYLKPGQILRVTPGDSPAMAKSKELDGRRAALERGNAPASAWWTLACDAKKAGESRLFRSSVNKVLALEPDHADARAALGQVRQDGRWMSAADAAAARGEVLFRGRWLTVAARDAILAEEKRVEAENDAREAKARERRLAELEVQKKEAEVRAARNAADAAASNTQEQGAFFGTLTPIQTANGVRWIPVSPGLPQPQPAPSGGGLSIQASGQNGSTNWRATYRD